MSIAVKRLGMLHDSSWKHSTARKHNIAYSVCTCVYTFPFYSVSSSLVPQLSPKFMQRSPSQHHYTPGGSEKLWFHSCMFPNTLQLGTFKKKCLIVILRPSAGIIWVWKSSLLHIELCFPPGGEAAGIASPKVKCILSFKCWVTLCESSLLWPVVCRQRTGFQKVSLLSWHLHALPSSIHPLYQFLTCSRWS